MSLNEQLKQNEFEFKKKYGQNFITDKNLLQSIVFDAELKKDDEVLEIGAGAGTMTQELCNFAKKVVAIEIDRTLKPILNENLKEFKNCEVLFDDFLKLNADEINSKFENSYKIVANLPYYITSPIIFKIIEENFNVLSMTLMVEKEVAEKLVSKSGTKDYRAITVQLGSVADVFVTRIVSREMFLPRPKVDSAIVKIVFNKNKYKIADMSFHREVVKTAFSMRRKTLFNCLKQQYNLTMQDLEQFFKTENISNQVRGEALTIEQFVHLSNYLKK